MPPPELRGQLREFMVPGRPPSKEVVFRVPSRLRLVGRIGSGAYACVAAFQDAGTGERMAVKKISNAFLDVQDGKRVLREVRLLRQLDHENIIRIIDMFPPELADFDDVYIATDLMETDLERIIISKQRLEELHCQVFMYQILRAISYLHRLDVAHRDLKPANVLVNKNCDVKICDFNLARVMHQPDKTPCLNLTGVVVTRWYRAPEVMLMESAYTASIDIWAVGLILCELIRRKPLAHGKTDQSQVLSIISAIGFPDADELDWLPKDSYGWRFLDGCPKTPKIAWSNILPAASKPACNAAAAMVRYDPAARVTARGAMELSFFSKLRAEDHTRHGEADKPSIPLDWSFDDFLPTKEILRVRLLSECAHFHPEILA